MNTPIDEELSINPEQVKSVVDESVEFRGDIVAKDPSKTILINGRVTGTVRSAGPVVVGDTGVVEGSVRAPKLALSGTIRRRSDADGVIVDGPLALTKGARLECSTVYRELHTKHGAVLAGMIAPMDSDYCWQLHQEGRLPFLDDIAQVNPTQAAAPVSAVVLSMPGRDAASAASDGHSDGEADRLQAAS